MQKIGSMHALVDNYKDIHSFTLWISIKIIQGFFLYRICPVYIPSLFPPYKQAKALIYNVFLKLSTEYGEC